MTTRLATAAAWLALGAAVAATPAAAACPDTALVARLAAAILDRQAPPPPPAGLSMEDALCARERLVAVLAQPFGDRVGWKVGLTNPAVQARFGVTQPVAGAIFHGTLRAASGAEIAAGYARLPVLESDLLVRIRDEGVNEAGDDPVALLRHLDAVIPFIELAELVYPPDTAWSGPLIVAINVGARLGVLGEAIPVEPTPAFAAALAGMTVGLTEGNREVARARGTALLGHPLNALAWLLQDLRAQGRRLRAGEHVALGSFSPPQRPQPGQVWTAIYEGLTPSPVAVTVRMR